jgi:putative ABC transport system ATP-binding protein
VSSEAPLISLRGIVKSYDGRIAALTGIDLDIARGEYLAIVGPSGCGKTTLLAILGLLDPPTEGTYCFDGVGLDLADRRACGRLRNRHIGFIFQSFHLIGDLTVFENVALPLEYRGLSPAALREPVEAALERVGMAARHGAYPRDLSGGQQQRVAVARAIVGRPRILLADEPTGSLDSTNGEQVMALIDELYRDGTTVCLVTHEPRFAARAGRVFRLHDGRGVG